MALYEHVFLARQDVTAQQVETLTEQLKSIITAGGGKIAKSEYWGIKSLAYRVKKNRRAHFTLLNIDAPAAAVAEMERQMRINEDVIRLLTVRVEEHEEGPSAMLRKREDSDRDDRGERGERRGGGGGRFDRERSGGGGDRGSRFAGRPPAASTPTAGEA
ncbi:MAG: 30S ribosomal protein S6 [Janthinobacterium lividum]